MKFTLSWLKDHLETDATLDAICARLTAIGLEVEDVDDKAAFKPFVIAKVVSAEQHPNADKLRVLMVDTGKAIRSRSSAGRRMRERASSALSRRPAPMCPASTSRSRWAISAASRAAA